MVIGGGPAGSAVSRLLSAWGHEVALLPGPTPRRPCIAESLPPSCRKPLAALGVLEAVEHGGFLPTDGNTAAWGEPELQTRDFDGGESGFQVVRERLDALLLETSRLAGTRVVRGGTVRDLERPADHGGVERSSVHWTGPDGAGTLRARWVLDCSGRSGVLARRGLRLREAAPATTALLGIWRADAWPLVNPSHTVVESYGDGWVWSVPVDPQRRYVAAMVDPRLTDLNRAAGMESMYLGEIAKTRHFRRILEGAVLDGSPWACAATRYGAVRHGGNGFLLVGDAGSFIDPLSSFGVKKALASGYLAAVVVNTCLVRPEMQPAALEFFDERERAANAGYGALAARHYAEAAERHRHPFWTSRASALPDRPPQRDEPGISPRDPRIVAALEALRSADGIRLRPSPRLGRVARPTVQGREVVLRDHLLSAAAPDGVRVFRGVDLAGLVALSGGFGRVPDLFEAYVRAHGPVALPDFLCALSALVALGMLENQSVT